MTTTSPRCARRPHRRRRLLLRHAQARRRRLAEGAVPLPRREVALLPRHARSRGFFHCFGCQEGGDVITFLMKIDGLSFAEAVERLADKYGVQLRREEGGDQPQRPRGPAAPAADRGPQGRPGVLRRAARPARGPGGAAVPRPARLRPGRRPPLRRRLRPARRRGAGPAPAWPELHRRGDRRRRAGRRWARRPYDRFRGRLLWPIRDASGDTIGFGARRIFDDDKIEAKYLNTPETPIYKKSQVLYGLDLARRDIARTSQAVVVEGYTDVMACHLAGVTTAVATCGTAFGDDHARVLRRFLARPRGVPRRGDLHLRRRRRRAEGRAAGLRGRPELRLPDLRRRRARRARPVRPATPAGRRRGARAGRHAGVPLYRFVLGNVVAKYDLDRADGRVDALREARVWSPASATSPRSTRSPASSPG